MKAAAQVPLVENEIKSTIASIKESYMELNKDMISLKNISSSSNTELLDYRSEYNSLKSKVLETIQTMKQLLNQLSSTDITNNKLQKDVSSLFETIDQTKLSNKENDFESIVKSIDERLSSYEPLTGDNSSYISIQEDPLSGGLIKFKDYGNELMKRRTEEIEQVKRITTEVASLSNDIKFETFNQGEKMNEIEGNIVKMSTNVKKAEKETQETEILTRKNKKGLYFLICVLLSLIFIIVYIISKMIK